MLHLQAFARRCQSVLIRSVQLASSMLFKLPCAHYAMSWHFDSSLASPAYCHQLIFVLRAGDKCSPNMHAWTYYDVYSSGCTKTLLCGKDEGCTTYRSSAPSSTRPMRMTSPNGLKRFFDIATKMATHRLKGWALHQQLRCMLVLGSSRSCSVYDRAV